MAFGLKIFRVNAIFLIDIVMKTEEELGIEINDEDAEGLANMQDIIDYVHALRVK
jgi:acyl carrier protein